MNNHIQMIGFLAETFIHSGTGQSIGAIDLPFSREKTTAYPFIPGSSIKGAFKDYVRQGLHSNDQEENNGTSEQEEKMNQIFGKSDNAGNLLFSDLRLLLLPVRSITTSYKLLTCPYLLNRLERDLQRVGLGNDLYFDHIEKDDIIYLKTETETETKTETQNIYLEELNFEIKQDTGVLEKIKKLLETIKKLVPYNPLDLEKNFAMVSDNAFQWFAENALCIQARNILDSETKSSSNLWYEETLPPDTIMYSLLMKRKGNQYVDDFFKKIQKHKYIQTGGNETVGQGWFQMKAVL